MKKSRVVKTEKLLAQLLETFQLCKTQGKNDVVFSNWDHAVLGEDAVK